MLVAITGANGFLGNYLSNYLEKNNIKVRRIQRKKDSRKIFYISKINEKTDWSNALENVDIVIHCAAKAHCFKLGNEAINSLYSFNLNVTKELGKQALKKGVKKFIFISTIKVFGEKTKFNEYFESNSKNDPKDHYALSKLSAENALKEITSKNKMELIIIRPPLIYGPGVKANFLQMINYIYKGYPIPLGSIRNKRSTLYIGNLANLILKCVNKNEVVGKILLASDGETISTKGLIIKIGLALGKKPFLIKVPKYFLLFLFSLIGKKTKINKLISSLNINSKETQEIMHWIPPYTIDEGLKETAKWYMSTKN